jgi:protein-tyrosine phosphatase
VNRIAALFLEFHDVDPRRRASQTGRRISMTVEDARAILDLIDDHPDVDVAVSCETGISRSAGIAAALCAIFGLPDDYIYKGSLPNNHCKQMLLTEAYRRYEASVQTPRVETL